MLESLLQDSTAYRVTCVSDLQDIDGRSQMRSGFAQESLSQCSRFGANPAFEGKICSHSRSFTIYIASGALLETNEQVADTLNQRSGSTPELPVPGATGQPCGDPPPIVRRGGADVDQCWSWKPRHGWWVSRHFDEAEKRRLLVGKTRVSECA